ncbi:MAG TPA: heme o synthase [Gammaproteobacteria bacterium]|nr:heme o synthase [Gammaproteobacteria bacterium]
MMKLVKSYLGLCKLKVVALIVFTAMVGMFLATLPPGMVPWDVLLLGNLGIGMAASAAAAINHVLDAREDAHMTRTSRRPLPQGEISQTGALVFAVVLAALSMVILVVFINTLTAVLTFFSLVGYAIVYTMYLKRATPQNIVIGGAAGAAPPVLGWAALTNTVDPHALLLFLIIFIWTPPHFWALAIHRRDEYAKVDIPMLPVTHGIPFTRLQILLYTIMLLVVSVLPFAMHMSGYFYLAGALLLGIGFLRYAIQLMQGKDVAMKTFGYSIWYLMAIFAILLVDHYLPLLR